MHHAINRAKERYDVALTVYDLATLRRQIEDNRAVKLADMTAAERWLVMHGDTAMIAVFDRVRRRILTFMPKPGTDHPDRKQAHRTTVQGRRPLGRERDGEAAET